MMKNKLHCDIVLDLLPSYIEGLTRENTNEAVKGHLENCESCQKSFEKMREPEQPEFTVEEKKEIDFLKKTKKKHFGIIVGCATLVIFMCVILFFVNAFCGNPISHFLAENAAKKYVEDNYSELGVYVDEVGYDLKLPGYYAEVKSDTSIDTHFIVYVSMLGEVESDDYYKVTDGTNTYDRLDMEYRVLAGSVLDELDIMGEKGFAFGTIETDEVNSYDYKPVQYGVNVSELELDKMYDIRKVASANGHLIVYAEDEEVTAEKLAELMLMIKKEFDEEEIPFFEINISLSEPMQEDYEYDPNNPPAEIYVEHFLYSDIYEEGMVERVQQACKD